MIPNSLPLINSRQSLPKGGRGSAKTARILIVDDGAQNRSLAAGLISAGKLGDSVQAENGLEALAVFRDWGPDLVITDFDMPEINGLNVIRMIRSMEFGVPQKTPILVVSGKLTHRRQEICLGAGAQACMKKPFDCEKFLEQAGLLLS